MYLNYYFVKLRNVLLFNVTLYSVSVKRHVTQLCQWSVVIFV